MLAWLDRKIRQRSLLNKIQEFKNTYKDNIGKNPDAEYKLYHYIVTIEDRINQHTWYLEKSKNLDLDLYDLRTLLAYEKDSFYNPLFVAALKVRNDLATFAAQTADVTSIDSNQIPSDDATEIFSEETQIIHGNEQRVIVLDGTRAAAILRSFENRRRANPLVSQAVATNPTVDDFVSECMPGCTIS